MRSRSPVPHYVTSPDMVAFTIGRLVCADILDGHEISREAIQARLKNIAQGKAEPLPKGVTPEMAAGALVFTRATLPETASITISSKR